MDLATAKELAELNSRFYEENAASFSETRASAWAGWRELARVLRWGDAEPGGHAPSAVLDVACGNRRLERFLHDVAPDGSFSYLGVDGCDALALAPENIAAGNSGAASSGYQHFDLVGGLLGDALPERLGGAREDFDLVACFGFMHHVPGAQNRAAFLRWLVGRARPGGVVAVSFWRFMDDARLAAKARATTARALEELRELDARDLEEGDYLLGWKDAAASYRYCHSFDDAEVGELAASVRELSMPVARYRADGRSGALNEYLALQRR